MLSYCEVLFRKWRTCCWRCYGVGDNLPPPSSSFARIHIVDAEGDVPAETEIELYDPMERSAFDVECGTFLSDAYAPEDGELCFVEMRRKRQKRKANKPKLTGRMLRKYCCFEFGLLALFPQVPELVTTEC